VANGDTRDIVEWPMDPKNSPPGDGSGQGKSSTLPPLAAQADSLDAIRKAVEDAAAVSGVLWLSYLFVLFYIAIAAGAVTHADLLLENPVKLPFLSVDLPLKAFFFLSPFLFLVTYAYTLAHLVLLADKAKRFHLLLREQVQAQGEGAENVDKHEATRIRDGLRRQLPSNIFVQFLVGPDDIREGWFGALLKTIAWTTLVIAPVFLLLLLQIQFLPYHNGWITWTQRLTLLVALILVWWLWRKILSGRGARRGWTSSPAIALGIVSSFAVLIFSWTVATYPGEWPEKLPSIRFIPAQSLLSKQPSNGSGPEPISLHEWLFAGKIDDITRRRKSLFSNTLVLPGFDIYEALKIDDPTKLDWKAHLVDLRGRHLERAVFDAANLAKVDLSGAYLEGASLDNAQLQGASLASARLQGASLLWTGLQSASLAQAQLQGASLSFTQFQGASLRQAQFQGAFLEGVQFMGASLDKAQFQGAFLLRVNFSGASLSHAQFQAASIASSEIWAASLEGAQLQGVALSSGFAATDLRKAVVWRAFGQLEMTRLLVSELAWGPQYLDENGQPAPWTQETYEGLRQKIEREVPLGEYRTNALKRIERLDCEKKKYSPFLEFENLNDSIRLPARGQQLDNISIDLAPCNPKAHPLDFSPEWRPDFERAGVNDKTYRNYLATILGALVCEGKDIVENVADERNVMFGLEAGHVSRFTAGGLATPWSHPEIGSIYILRGLFKNGRFDATGAEAPALAQRILDKDCPVSAALTAEDKETLRGFQKFPEQTNVQK
jgi:uncharacterized protein YjbI with pentapeptide repeats